MWLSVLEERMRSSQVTSGYGVAVLTSISLGSTVLLLFPMDKIEGRG
uniref:Uncharacterized protein n=1 Tax=Physcomitrium patens TaxID=3218 RepID=A0A7I4DZ87_PHYPA